MTSDQSPVAAHGCAPAVRDGMSIFEDLAHQYIDGEWLAGTGSWDIIDVYQKHSPMFNVKGVSTPTMIQHGESDVRVPISQGYEFYNALKAQGVPVRMLVLPRQPHGPNEPKMQVITMKSNLEWFDKYIGGKSETSRN